MKEFITMSEKELERLKVTQQLESRQTTRKKAHQLLGLTPGYSCSVHLSMVTVFRAISQTDEMLML